MKKTVTKRITALLLSVILAVGMLITPVSAATTVKGVMKEVAIDKLVETGMRVAAEACEELGEATGTEAGEEIFSFIADWVFSSGAESAANKAKELCEEILEQIKELEIEINDDFSVVESQISQEAVNAAKTNLQNKWKSDVDNVISYNNATASLDSYKSYLNNSIENNAKYHDGSITYSELQDSVEADLEDLLDAFYTMYVLVDGESSSSDDKDYAMFHSEKMNATFENMITLLATNLDAVESGSVEEYAVQYACNAFQFSHQQYSFVHNYVEKQILQLILVEMMYNEYLYQQGAFIEDYESEGKDSKAYQDYLDHQDDFYKLMNETVKNHITNMLNREVVADSTQKFSLDSYMKPEDAVADDLKINGYKTYYSVHGTTNRKYIFDTVRFNRVMTQTGNKNNVYYILDPSQFSDSNATKALAMDTKIDNSGDFDTHIPSCDYLNLTNNSMSDGVNTFACSADIFGLFDTKAFRWLDSKPSTYLKEYIPSGTTIFMTPKYEYGTTALFDTTYEKFWVIEGDTAVSGSDVSTKEYSAEAFQSDKGGDKYSYSVVLANNSDEYKQKAAFKIPAHLEASVTDSDGNKIIDTTRGDASPSANITSGKMLTIKFKVDDGYCVESLKCIRNNSTSTETVLFDSDDIDILKTDGEYYTFSYPMPYSNTTFEFKVVSDEGEYDIWTPEDLISFSNDMNNGVNPDTTANLCADIDMTGCEGKFSPVGNSAHPFKGVFNGNNHKIEGLKFENYDYSGLFGYIENAEIKDVTISGDFSLAESSKIKQAGGAVGYANGGSLTNITSYVTISNAGANLVLPNVGGIVGSVGENETTIENCLFGGTLDLSGCVQYTGGIVGKVEKGAVIKSCASVGTINTAKSSAFAGGILGFQKGKTVTIENCYNYSKIGGSQEEDPDSLFGAIIGYIDAEDGSDNISDNYYLDTSCDKVIGFSYANIGDPDSLATKKSAAQFASGEVAYLLNHKVTNGTQVWYQNIDNGKTPDAYPVFEGGTVYFGYACDSESKIYSNYELGDDPSGHKFNDNGFCTKCGQYQPATLNSGVYEITNAGNLFWFASLVNNDSTHAEFDKQNTGANAVLVKDINLENREWSPIMNFVGTFDGGNHTISNLNITNTSTYSGLFGKTSGTIKNFTVKGNITLSADGDMIGGAVGYADGATIKNVTSYVNISNTDGALKHIGGVVGGIQNNETFVDKCVYYGTMNIKNSTDCIGGIIGYTNGGARISNCANHGAVKTSKEGAYTGGILGYVNNTNPTVKDCYNYGTVSNSGDTTYCGAIIGCARNYTTSNIDNNYYLDSSETLAFGSGSKSGATATAKTADEFKSGEVAYLLNHKVTDGTQVWYQNIDNGKTPDDYPVFDGGTVYFGYDYICNASEQKYSNYPLSSNPTVHNFDSNGFCINCGAYQPATLNSDGVYEIGNAGQLFWFASLVNNDSTHADFDAQNTGANAVLLKDINLESREWSPIMNFSGTFDGDNYTISDLKITNTSTYSGLFGKTSGTIKSLTLKGDITLSSDGDKIGGVVGCAGGATVSDVVSYVNISNTDGVLHHIGGVIGYIENIETFVDKCVYYGTVDIKNSTDCIGGIVGYTNGGARISNCANHGTVTTSEEGAYTGGILGYVNNPNITLKDCYNYGTVSNGDSTTYCGAIIGWARDYTAINIDNNYYLDSSSTLAFGSGGKSEVTATEKTADEFKSGEVTYLLNHKVTDGTQAWYQNLDNGKIPNLYPTLTNNNENTVYTLLDNKGYSNYPQTEKISVLERVDLRTYHRILKNDGSFSDSSQITTGFGLVDNKNKIITVYTTEKAERLGILANQGADGSAGFMTLEGYDEFKFDDKTSADLIAEGSEPDIYVDANKCIFIKIPEDGSDVTGLTVNYTQKPTSEYKTTQYTLNVVTVSLEHFNTVGASYVALSENDPDYAVAAGSKTDEPSTEEPTTAPTESTVEEQSTVSSNPTAQDSTSSTSGSDTTKSASGTAVQTGSVTSGAILLVLLMSAMAFLYAYRKRRSEK